MNILLNAVFIPAFGYVAAAYTTVACYLLYYLLHVAFSWWVHKGMVYDILQQFLWLGVVSVVSLVTVALTDLFWIRMGLLAGPSGRVRAVGSPPPGPGGPDPCGVPPEIGLKSGTKPRVLRDIPPCPGTEI